jgi:hypothetical protein
LGVIASPYWLGCDESVTAVPGNSEGGVVRHGGDSAGSRWMGEVSVSVRSWLKINEWREPSGFNSLRINKTFFTCHGGS